MDCNLSGSSVHGIFQARVLEWVAISFSQGIFPAQGSNPGLARCRQTPGRSTTFQNKKVETKMVLLYMFTSCPPGLTEHHSPPLQAHLPHCRLRHTHHPQAATLRPCVLCSGLGEGEAGDGGPRSALLTTQGLG